MNNVSFLFKGVVTFIIYILSLKSYGDRIKYVDINFYGDKISIPFDSVYLSFNIQSTNPDSFNKYFEKSIKLDNQIFIDKLKDLKVKYRLDDFGYVILLSKVANSVFAKRSPKLRKLFIWFILLQNNYDVVLGYNASDIVVLGAHDVGLLSGSIYLEKRRYIDINYDGNYNFRTFKLFKHYMNLRKVKLKSLVLNYKELPNLPSLKVIKKIKFLYNDTTYEFNYEINKRLIEYYADLPLFIISKNQVGMNFSEGIRSSLIKQLKECLSKINNREVEINFLLSFVQNCFRYKTDQENGGFEKHNFSEETLCYEFSDCDDKVILFASLLKEIYNINSLVLEYSEHVNIGINYYKSDKDWKYVLFEEDKYTECNPTGTGFLLGKSNYENPPSLIRKLW